MPEVLRRGIYNFSDIFQNQKFNFGKEYLSRLALNQEPFWGLAIAFGNEEKRKLLSPNFKSKTPDSSYDIPNYYYKNIRTATKTDFLKEITYLEIKNRLPELLLARADKMTMAHSVEGRVPFLDTRLVELAFNIPTKTKIRGGETKYILKRAVQGIIPNEIINRKKQGFSNPFSEWLKPGNPISKELTDIIFNSKLREGNILNYDYINEIIRAHQKQNIDQNFKIWTLITLSIWYDYWF